MFSEILLGTNRFGAFSSIIQEGYLFSDTTILPVARGTVSLSVVVVVPVNVIPHGEDNLETWSQ